MGRRAVKQTLNPNQAFFDGTPEEKKADRYLGIAIGIAASLVRFPLT